MNANIIKDPLLKTGALSYFAIKSAAGVAESALQTGTDGLQQANALDPGTMERAGYNIGSGVASLTQLGVDLGFLHNSWTRYGGATKWMKNGELFNNAVEGGVKGVFNPGMRSKLTFSAMRPSNPSGFMRNWGLLRGLGLTMALPIVAGMALSPALGFAGKVIGENWAINRKLSDVRYDNRFFQFNKEDVSTSQSVGMALNNYESKIISLSRIYHSR